MILRIIEILIVLVLVSAWIKVMLWHWNKHTKKHG